MASLKILSGGAAQGLVTALAPAFETETGLDLDGSFGAVGAMRARLQAGEEADIVILTAALIRELGEEGLVLDASARDLGTVETAIAVRSGDPRPASVADAAGLAAALKEADAVYFPDPERATAGIHFAKVLRSLGLWEELSGRLRPFANGATAMRELATSDTRSPIGCTQATEIIITPGVTLISPLPPGLDLRTVYTAAVGTRVARPDAARRFVDMLLDDGRREERRSAGFGP
jgi:molybdate transport system substrate-binding protein